jgi:His-Xaa-Ser system radical SAM maturase HxsC
MITIAIWNKCNNECLMCTNPPGYQDGGGYDYEDLAVRYGNLNNGETEIQLTGGEPTLHPRFFDVLGFFRKKCPLAKITLITNGRRFGEPDFTKKCLAIGNIDFQISLHGPNDELHDKITKAKGSFKETVRGIQNILDLRSRDSELELRIVIHKAALPCLKKTYQFMTDNFPRAERIVFIFMEMEGMAGVNIKRTGIRFKNILPYLEKLFGNFKTSPTEIRLYHFPLCVLSPKFWPYAWRTLPQKEIIFLPACEKCNYKNHCLGIHKLYPEYMGIKEFKPILRMNLPVKFTNNFYHPIQKYGR